MITSIISPNYNNVNAFEVMVAMNPCQEVNALVDGLLNLNMKVYLAKSSTDALAKMQVRSFHLVFLEEGYCVEAMQLLAALPSGVRRNIYYIFIGDSIETGNMMQSYVLSANLVINRGDLASVVPSLPTWINDNNRFYRPLYYAIEKQQKLV